MPICFKWGRAASWSRTDISKGFSTAFWFLSPYNFRKALGAGISSTLGVSSFSV